MIEKTKLSLWDFFVSILSGHAIMLSILAHCIVKGRITWKMIFDSPTALLAVAGLLTIILAGSLFEPLANYITKLLTTYPRKYVKSFGFEAWDSNIRALEMKARQYVPQGIEESTYQYCKNYLRQNASDDSYVPFLAKYGFYRSMFLLFLLNAISILCIYQFSRIKTIIISLSMVVLALVYLRRSCDYYRHISTTVYSQFISLFQ